MKKKKILIISKAFYPELTPRSFRTTELVREFARQGHDVTLYTLKNNKIHEPIEKEFGVKIKDLGNLNLDEINTESSNKLISLFKRFLRRTLLMLFEYPDIKLMFRVKKILKNLSGYDLLISIAVPHPIHWGVALAWNKKKPVAKKWIADCGDPYMGMTADTFRKLFYFKFFEKAFCRKADKISITKIEMKDNYYKEFHHKIIEITQGFKFDDIKISEGPVSNKIPTFAYAGTFLKTRRNPEQLLKFLSNYKKDFRFIIYTRTPDLVMPYKEILKEKLIINNFLSREVLLQELSRMDFLINMGYDPVLLMPSKLVDYYLSGRPVINFKTNEIDEPMFTEFLEGDYSKKLEFKDIDKFKIEKVCEKFLDILQ